MVIENMSRARRSPATLHRLLWGVEATRADLRTWTIRPWEVPAVGLPARVAVGLFARAQAPAADADATGPFTWELRGYQSAELAALVAGRRAQLGYAPHEQEHHDDSPDEERSEDGGPDDDDASGSGEGATSTRRPRAETLVVSRTTAWEVLPHAAYYLPFVAASSGGRRSQALGSIVHPDSYALYCDVLSLLTALDGGEAILDGLVRRGTGSLPFEERWAWRARIHLPAAAWRLIDEAVRWAMKPSAPPGGSASEAGANLLRALQGLIPERISADEFAEERVDLYLDGATDEEVVRTVLPARGVHRSAAAMVPLREETLARELTVRIGQIAAWADGRSVLADFPRVSFGDAQRIMEQVAEVFRSPGDAGGARGAQGPDEREVSLVLLPEVAIPQAEVQTVRDLARATGRASLAGLYWRVLPPVYAPARGVQPARRWFVNEAELVVPVGSDDRGPSFVRWFRVRKPSPAHMEAGLAQALTNRDSANACWSILGGRRWYRFVHSRWGDFTVAICSDLLETDPWSSLRGEVLHLLMVAYNRDIDLFESLSWVRAYENFVNLVTVNHGAMGGSFSWTPRRSHGHEIAQLRGVQMFLQADVRLPVRALLKAQRQGAQEAVARTAQQWTDSDHPIPEGPFRAPPPGFVSGR